MDNKLHWIYSGLRTQRYPIWPFWRQMYVCPLKTQESHKHRHNEIPLFFNQSFFNQSLGCYHIQHKLSILLDHSFDHSFRFCWVRGSNCSHSPPSARRTSWGRRRTRPEPAQSSGFTPGVRRNLSRVRATTTRSSARANFWPIQFLRKLPGSNQISFTINVQQHWRRSTWVPRKRGWRREKTAPLFL